MSDAAKLQTLQEEFGNRFINGAIPAHEYQHDGKRVNMHSTLFSSWKEQDTSGQPSRTARADVRTSLLKELPVTRPDG